MATLYSQRFAHPDITRTLLAYLARLLPQRVIDALIAKKSYYALGIITGLSLFVEEKKRREELAMYVMPKGLESAWLMARGRGWVGRTGQWGEVLVSGSRPCLSL